MSILSRRPGIDPGPLEAGRTRWPAIPAFAGMTIAFASLLLAGVAIAQGPPPMPKPLTLADRPNATGGEKLYVVKCAMCHGPNGMAQGLLGRRKGVEPDLEKRSDLKKNYVILAARSGIGNMPAIPRGEASDEELEAIADYLAAGPNR